jgi:hypothetical protein
MSSCAHLDARDQARATIARLAGRPEVLGTDLVDPDTDPTGRWTVEIAIDADAVPPAVLQILADEGLSIYDAGPRAEWHCLVAVV